MSSLFIALFQLALQRLYYRLHGSKRSASVEESAKDMASRPG
jgi:hypothetical protein